MFKLEEKHLEAAQAIAARNRTKKSCDHCYDRGWIGVSEQNMLVLCTRCVDMDKSMDEWKQYVMEHEDLKEHYGDLFEEKELEETEESHVAPTKPEHKREHNQPRQSFVPGQKRTGRAKKV